MSLVMSTHYSKGTGTTLEYFWEPRHKTCTAPKKNMHCSGAQQCCNIVATLLQHLVATFCCNIVATLLQHFKTHCSKKTCTASEHNNVATMLQHCCNILTRTAPECNNVATLLQHFKTHCSKKKHALLRSTTMLQQCCNIVATF